LQDVVMSLLSVQEVSFQLSVPAAVIEELIEKKIITPYGGRARLGEPRFCSQSLVEIREQITLFTAQ
jgi:hypothetical protein